MSTETSPGLLTARIRALRKTGLLERAGREQFGHLTELVRTALGVPVAIVSIVDEDRQVFAGHCGLPEPWASMGETPISHSFCQIVVDSDDVLCVVDAPNDPRVRDNQAIADLGVVAYLGVPIRLPSGELAGALAAIDTKPRVWTDHELATLRSVATVVDKEIRVGTSERKYRTLIEDMREGFYAARSVRDDNGAFVDLIIEEINPAFERLTGMTAQSVIGARVSMLAPGAQADMLPVYERVLKTRTSETIVNEAHANVGRWFETRIRAIDGEHLVAFFSDVTKRMRAEKEQALRNLEIRHRLKNNLSLVQALAGQTLRKSVGESLMDAFDQRLLALSSAHDVLFKENWLGASLLVALKEPIDVLGFIDRCTFSGPDIVFSADATLSISMLVHELTTNAVKYGALSVDEGRIEVVWTIDGSDAQEELHLRWREIDGPTVQPPDRTGFGSKLIRLGLSGAGRVTIDFDPAGVVVTMSAPLARLQKTIDGAA